MIKKILGTLSILLFSSWVITANAAFSDQLYQCPFAGSSGDLTFRAFYLENYPSNTLGGVVLGLSARSAGQYTIALDARENTFDGTLIGTASQTVDLNTLSFDNLLVEFDFANAPVTSTIVTFKIRITSGSGSVYFDTGTGSCTDVVKTEDSSPPLSTPRFNSVGVEVYATSGIAQPTTYTVGGTVSNLTGTGLQLQNGSETLAVAAAATAFTFTTELADSAAYAVTVSTQPTGQTCSVTGGDNNLGAGTIAAADVTSVAVSCVTNAVPTHTVSGTVSGLTGSVTLQNNGGDDITKTTNDGFTFAAQVEGTDYAVTVSSQPAGQTCTVTNGSGTNITADVANVSVACADSPTAPPMPATPIPTLSKWALILLSMLLGLVAFARTGRQQA